MGMEYVEGGIVAALVAVVGVLWRLHTTKTKEEEERLEKCEELHKKSQDTVLQLTANYHELKGRMDGVETLSHSILTKLEEIQIEK